MKRSGFKRKAPKLKKKKYVSPQKKRSKLKKQLWQVFSLYIRTRDKFTCITCGRVGEKSAIHAGHFIPSSVGGLMLRYDDGNVYAQCYHCNINLGGWGERYAEVLEARYGKEHVDTLRRKKSDSIQDKDYPFEEKIKYFEDKLKALNGMSNLL